MNFTSLPLKFSDVGILNLNLSSTSKLMSLGGEAVAGIMVTSESHGELGCLEVSSIGFFTGCFFLGFFLRSSKVRGTRSFSLFSALLPLKGAIKS